MSEVKRRSAKQKREGLTRAFLFTDVTVDIVDNGELVCRGLKYISLT